MIYILEDDNSIRNLVIYAINGSGMTAQGFDRPSRFWEAVEAEPPTLVLLDIMLPEEDGLSVLGKLRRRPDTAKCPVIMLTARGTEYDKVLGLDSGADDYVSKPFGIMELLSRIRALLRRTEPEEPAPDEYTAGKLKLSLARHRVTEDGREIALTNREFELLALLIMHPGKVFTRDQILRQVWGMEFDGENRTVDVHIRALRSKLTGSGDRIQTVRGLGYKLEADE